MILPRRVCKILDCGRPEHISYKKKGGAANRNGYCAAHSRRQARHGDPLKIRCVSRHCTNTFIKETIRPASGGNRVHTEEAGSELCPSCLAKRIRECKNCGDPFYPYHPGIARCATCRTSAKR